MKRALPADFYVALVLIAAGGVVLNDLARAGLTGPYATPATLPMASAAALVGLSVVLLLGALRRRVAAEGGGLPTGAAALRVLGLLGATALFIFTMPLLGYLAASGLFMLLAGLLFGNRNPLSLVLTAVIAPVALYFFFEKVMLVFLPAPTVLG